MTTVSQLLLCLLLLHGAYAQTGAQQQYFCLENYKPIGQIFRNVSVNEAANSTVSTSSSNAAARVTSGHTARWCSTFCDAEAACTAFRAVGADAVGGPACQLLTQTTADLPKALVVPLGANWAQVLSDVRPKDGIALRSLAWVCFRGVETWGTFGLATHALIQTGIADPNADIPGPSRTPWCAMGTDVAGSNTNQLTTIQHPSDCDAICVNMSDACAMWTFCASKKGSGQAPLNCFLKIDPFRGQNGWTGPPKVDIWIPDSQMDCFVDKNDFRQLGLILSPAVHTVSLGSSYFTVFPERVTWQQANASCSLLPGGRLAVLDTRQALDLVYRSLLTTLPSQTAVRSAWVGATGNNTAYDPGSPAMTGINAATSPNGTPPSQSSRLGAVTLRSANQPGPEDTLRWSTGQPVAEWQRRRLEALPAIWSVHDVIWAQQFVPANVTGICGRVLVQTASPQQAMLDAAAVLPGIWYFDCEKPASFICESTAPLLEPMSGRTPVLDYQNQSGPNPAWDANFVAPWKIALATLLPTLVVLGLAWQWIHFRASRSSRRLPDLLWQQKKRLAGAPKSGDLAVVVTDIQDFTRLTQEAPDAMVQALILHNQIVQKAAYDHVGYVLEQEGDSFTLAFHEPLDAVQFTLQVQQALQEQVWPPGLHYPGPTPQQPTAADPDGTAAAAALSPSQRQHSRGSLVPHQLTSRASLDQGLLRWLSSTVSAAVGGAGSSEKRPSDDGRQRRASEDGRRRSETSNADAADSSVAQASQESSNRVDVLPGIPNGAVYSPGGAAAADETTREKHKSGGVRHSTDTFPGLSPNSYSPVPRTGTANSLFSSNPFSSNSIAVARHRNAWLQQLLSPGRYHGSNSVTQQQQDQRQQLLFNGLRVRMGVASGHVPRGEEVKRSKVYRMSQDVSTAAAGGQVLLDSGTFAAVKESMRRLGLITAAGLDYEQLYAASSSKGRGRRARNSSMLSDGSGSGHAIGWYSTAGDWVSSLVPSRLRSSNSAGSTLLPAARPAEYAVAFDMGCYEVLPAATAAAGSGGGVTGPSAMHRGSSSSGRETIPLWGNELGLRLVEQYQRYLQELLQQQAGVSGNDSIRFSPSSEDGFASAVGGGRSGQSDGHSALFSMDDEQPYMLHSYLRTLSQARPPSENQEQLGDLQRHYPHGGQHMQDDELASDDLDEQQQKGTYGHKGLGGGLRRLTHGILGIGVLPHHQQQQPQHLVVVRSNSLVRQLGTVKSMRRTSLDSTAGSSTAVSAGPQLPAALPTVRLYQVVAPALAGRAAVFGSHLALPRTWHCIDAAYFSAPGVSGVSTPTGHLQLPAPNAVQSGSATAAPPAAATTTAGESNSMAPGNSMLRQASAAPGTPELADGSFTTSAAAPATQPATSVTAPSNSPFAAAAAAATAAAHEGNTAANGHQQQLQLQPNAIRAASGASAVDGAAFAAKSPPSGAAAAAGPSRVCPVLPVVTVVFVSVEGAYQLSAHPDLARSLHQVLHRLMLQLLSAHFPGSYLIRAQEGELRYLAAFNTPTAAAAWCLTLTEAALYAPYPHLLLSFPGFGVQLDAAGRLVFRGPRLKAGFSEGSPNAILPDHMCRADYAGVFVNRAARFADAAAQGGRLVTDADLASKILQHWQQQQQQLQQQQWQQQNHTHLLQQSGSQGWDGTGAPIPTHSSSGRNTAASPSLETPPAAAAAAAAAAAGPATLSSDVIPSPSVQLTAVSIDVQHLGSYLFKGSPRPVDMVALSPELLAGRSYNEAGPQGKGLRVVQRVGSMGIATVMLPAAVDQAGYSGAAV